MARNLADWASEREYRIIEVLWDLRGLKLYLAGAVRAVRVPPQLVTLLRCHIRAYGTAADGQQFGTKSVYGRVWHAVRADAPGAEPPATSLVRRP